MAENYDLIFGQSASQQYAWSDSDYQNGWGTVGSTPPTAEQFDALQRKSDMKAKDLNDRLSPLETKVEADGRQAATTYTAGAMLTVDGLPNGWLLECIVPGISGTDAITLPDTLIDGLTIIDGDVTWALRKVATNGSLGYRQPNETVTAGTIRYHQSLLTGYYLECTTQGITSAGDITPSSTIGDTITDGTVTWTVSRDLPLIGGGALTGSNLTWNANDLGGSAIVAKSIGGGNGYIKYASGLIIQWGAVTPGSGTTMFSVQFPISFSSSATYELTAITQEGLSNLRIISSSTESAAVFYFTNSTTNARKISWIAIGY